MNLHREHHFEREICEHLGAHGWLYAEGDAGTMTAPTAFTLPTCWRGSKRPSPIAGSV